MATVPPTRPTFPVVPEDRARRRTLLVAALALVALAYANALSVPFVWDDHELIVDQAGLDDNGGLRHTLLSDLFRGSQSGTSEYFRPLVTLSLIIDGSLWGGRPAGFHFTNLLLHLVVCALLWKLTSRHAPPLLAAAATLTFGLFPRLTEAVTWISGRGDLLAAGGVLAALCTVQSTCSRWWRSGLVTASLLAAMLAKEIGLAGAIAVVLLADRRSDRSAPSADDLAAGTGCATAAPRPAVRHADVAAATIAVVVYLALRMTAVAAPSVATTARLGPWRTVLQLIESLGTFAWMAVTPWAANLQIGAAGVLDPLRLGLGVVVLVCVAAVARRALSGDRRARLPAILIATSALALAPALWVAGLESEADAADRYLYLPLALACAAAAIWAAPRPRARTLAIAGLAAAVPFSVLTFARNGLWRDELTLWRHDAARASPYSSVVHEAIGDIELRRRLYSAAERAFAAAMRALDRQLLEQNLDRRGSRSRIGGKLASCLFEIGERQRAATISRYLAQTHPDDPRHLVNLVKVAAADLDFDRAGQLLASLTTRFPASNEVRETAGMVAKARRRMRSLPPRAADEKLTVTVERAQLLAIVHRLPAADDAWWRVATAPQADSELVADAAAFLAIYGRPQRAATVLQRLAAMGFPETRLAPYRELLAQRLRPAMTTSVTIGIEP